MLKKIVFVALVALLSACAKAPTSQVAVNPLTYTDIPDPDIIRVGEDYYMVSTTRYFCPGAPIMHSRDLVHWEIVSYTEKSVPLNFSSFSKRTSGFVRLSPWICISVMVSPQMQEARSRRRENAAGNFSFSNAILSFLYCPGKVKLFQSRGSTRR